MRKLHATAHKPQNLLQREHISELGFRFSGKDKSSRSRNRDHLRRLLFERMEDRRLLAVIDLAVLSAAQGSTIFGAEAGDSSGFAVNSVGDVNGDGYDDLFIGAAGGDAAGNLKAGAGDSYLIFGGPSLATQIDLASPGSAGVTIFGADAGDGAGNAVSSAGDVNGDGFDDLIIGSPGADAAGNLKTNAGESYVIYGGASLPATIDLANLGSAGITIFGVDADDKSGTRVNSAGDVNGDGYDDLVIGANSAGAAGNLKPEARESYVIFGGPSLPATIDLAILGSAGITIFGADAGDYSDRVSSAGDVNGDGFDDLIIGSPGADGPNNLQDGVGESYVIFGGEFLPVTIDLASLGSAGITIFGAGPDASGRSVSSAGDVNGDGYDDLLIGAYAAGALDNLKPGAGESYVIFGGASLPTTIYLASLGSAGITIFGADAGDTLGNITLSSIGDLNADGFDDLHIGAGNADAAGNLKTGAGDSYVIFGGASLPATIDLANLGSAGITIFGADADDGSGGKTVRSSSDINGDGFNDLLIGASAADAAGNLKPGAGESYVIFGGNGFTSSVTLLGTANAETLTGTAAADVMNGGRGNDTLIGGGGADVLTGGQGNDVLAVSDLTFKRIVGGTGSDTLRLDGSGLSLNLTTLADNRLLGIESIDITGSGNNTLTLNQREVLNLSDESNTLVVPCDAGDVVNIGSGWTQGANENTFSVFTQGAAKLKVSSSGTIVDAIASPAVFVTPTTWGLFTSEAVGTATFTVRLGSPPTATVTIPVSSSDTTEGTVSTSSLTFNSGNWNQPQTVTITGVDDNLLDGSIVYTIFLAAATSLDSLYNGLDPTDVTVTNTDNDTKFYVVNDSLTDQTYRYATVGNSIGNSALDTGNTAPRGAASTIAGNKLWVVDTNRKVFVYNTSGGLLGSWTAGGLTASSLPEGITVNGNDVWIVDNKTDKVFRYANAASLTSGSPKATSSFSLNSGNTNPKDLVTDGTSIWVVDDSTTDKVFKYSASGTFQGSWTILSGGGRATGITLDPSNASQSLWIVYRSDYASYENSVHEYANARGNISGSQAASVTFVLAAGNTNPQGIADPPPPSSGVSTAPASVVGNNLLAVNAVASSFMQAPIVSLGVPSTERAAQLQTVSAVTESVDEAMSQLASLPAAPISVSKLQSTSLQSRTRFAEDQSIDLALADEELHDSLHTIANDLFESTLR